MGCSIKFSKEIFPLRSTQHKHSSYNSLLLMFVELIQHSILHKVLDDIDDAEIAN